MQGVRWGCTPTLQMPHAPPSSWHRAWTVATRAARPGFLLALAVTIALVSALLVAGWYGKRAYYQRCIYADGAGDPWCQRWHPRRG